MDSNANEDCSTSFGSSLGLDSAISTFSTDEDDEGRRFLVSSTLTICSFFSERSSPKGYSQPKKETAPQATLPPSAPRSPESQTLSLLNSCLGFPFWFSRSLVPSRAANPRQSKRWRFHAGILRWESVDHRRAL